MELECLVEEGQETCSAQKHPEVRDHFRSACQRTSQILAVLVFPAVLLVVLHFQGSPRHFVASLLQSTSLTQIYLPPAVPKEGVLADQEDDVIDLQRHKVELQNATGWPPATLLHKGENCWSPCGNISGDCAWCGVGNACCRYMASNDPPECYGATFSETRWHTCVVPAKPHAVKHKSQDCFFACHGKAGFCSWCGEGNACCREGDAYYAAECGGASHVNSIRRTCVSTAGQCPQGMTSDGQGGCKRPLEAPTMSFYVYKSGTPDSSRLMYENFANLSTNAASLAGVLFYLHTQVVTDCPRKHGVDRIQRYILTVKAPQKFYEDEGTNFDKFVLFERAQCAELGCGKRYDEHGFVVGCKHVDPNMDQAYYENAIWYSIPGENPSKRAKQHHQPGGQCEKPDGSATCTWHAEFAGEVFLDELVGIVDQTLFCSGGNYEYDLESDAGIGNSFWDGKMNAAECAEREKRLNALFVKKYPNLPSQLGSHPCDAD
eukprot:TRINITY_DN78845_c0_g1_i1.p1 TRINITY_DN78845_c0_g1~~TRINITY_DN78845_c0_g1_i1.p1  ORF type:complete len:490 (-),score=75.96 TRINITY_DN78845_c0_g1_i1:60-1529(-)